MTTRPTNSVPQDLWSAHLRKVGDFIRKQRTIAELSQRELARVTKLSDTYLSQLERGLHQPSLAVLRSIAQGLGLHADEFIGFAAGLDGEPEQAEASEVTDAAGPVTTSTEDTIRRDPRLSPSQRDALLGVLQSFLATGESASATKPKRR